MTAIIRSCYTGYVIKKNNMKSQIPQWLEQQADNLERMIKKPPSKEWFEEYALTEWFQENLVEKEEQEEDSSGNEYREHLDSQL